MGHPELKGHHSLQATSPWFGCPYELFLLVSSNGAWRRDRSIKYRETDECPTPGNGMGHSSPLPSLPPPLPSLPSSLFPSSHKHLLGTRAMPVTHSSGHWEHTPGTGNTLVNKIKSPLLGHLHSGGTFCMWVWVCVVRHRCGWWRIQAKMFFELLGTPPRSKQRPESRERDGTQAA